MATHAQCRHYNIIHTTEKKTMPTHTHTRRRARTPARIDDVSTHFCPLNLLSENKQNRIFLRMLMQLKYPRIVTSLVFNKIIVKINLIHHITVVISNCTFLGIERKFTNNCFNTTKYEHLVKFLNSPWSIRELSSRNTPVPPS